MRKKLTTLCLLTLACSTGAPAPRQHSSAPLAPYRETIPGTLVEFDMIPVPGESPLWIGKTEVTWDEYDVFAYSLDQPSGNVPDAVARPSRPYGAPDYGWGHQGYPAISIAAPAAAAYAQWLSSRTGKRYRLPTDGEWTRAATAGLGPDRLEGALLDSLAWHSGNAGARSHPVARKRPDRLGLFDMLGNAAEWVVGPDGRPRTRGGSWRDAATSLTIITHAIPSPAWQERDPQFPKSRWWLSDGPFVGFRIVREP